MNKSSHGIGLSLCKKIVAVLEGDLDVISETGKGAMFLFSFKSEKLVHGSVQASTEQIINF